MLFESVQLLMLLQWMDSAFPTGAFAHSGGLETYTQVEAVRSPDDLLRVMEAKLSGASTTDMVVVKEAMSANQAQIARLDELCSAAKLARETREASEKIGRRMLSSVLNLTSDARLLAYQGEITAGRCAGHHAVVHGLACGALGVDTRAALLTFGYALAANQTAASLKLMRIGQTQAQAVLGAFGAAIEAAVETALVLTLDDYGSFAPGLDIRAMEHEHLFRRLFIS
jgi:urease accessory protein